MTTQSVDIAHLIQVALTPIFLISAIGVILNVLTSRLARIVDRARAMEERMLRPDYVQDGRDLHSQLIILARRSRWINASITLITLSALFIALVVVMLFVNAFLRWDLSVFIACMFILSMLTLAAALGWCLAMAASAKKANALSSKNLILIPMRSVLHLTESGRPEGHMRRILFACLAVAAAALGSDAALAAGQMMPGGQGGMGGQGMGRGSGMNQPRDEIPSTTTTEKPDAAAKKAYTAGMKSLNKAKAYAAEAANAPNADKKNSALIKVNDAYGRALDQFTEALSNNGDMVDAWNNVGYIHLRLGAYAESVDDYNHTLALKPDLLEAIEHRAEACVAIDRLDDAKSAYMDLFNHDRPLADQLMLVMQQWLTEHRATANGMRASDIDAFDKWLRERDGIAKQTASLPH
jgi:hypothetical protein